MVHQPKHVLIDATKSFRWLNTFYHLRFLTEANLSLHVYSMNNKKNVNNLFKSLLGSVLHFYLMAIADEKVNTHIQKSLDILPFTINKSVFQLRLANLKRSLGRKLYKYCIFVYTFVDSRHHRKC